jgi:hypothetical protein
MHAVIRHYHFDPKDSKEIAEKLTNGFMPIMKKAKGFIRSTGSTTERVRGPHSVFSAPVKKRMSPSLWLPSGFTRTSRPPRS